MTLVMDRIAFQYGINHIVHGACKRLVWDKGQREYVGADYLAGKWAFLRCIPQTIHPAHWERDGKAAGILRNQRMLDQEHPQYCVHFPGDAGTQDMVRRAQRAGCTLINAMEVDLK